MSLVIYIWKGHDPKLAIFNAIFSEDVGHAAISIEISKEDYNCLSEITKNYEKSTEDDYSYDIYKKCLEKEYVKYRGHSKVKSPKFLGFMASLREYSNKYYLYISHRPLLLSEESRNKDDSKKYFLKSYVNKGFPISYKDDCMFRKRKPDDIIKIPNMTYFGVPIINVSRMVSYYKKYLLNDLPKSESYYHVSKNNCCSVVVNFIRIGLDCPEIKKRCYKCSRLKYIKGYNYIRFGLILTILFRYLPNLLPFIPIPIVITAIFTILMSIVVILLGTSNLERLIMNVNFWSPITLHNYVNKVKDRIKDRKFFCCRNENLGFLNMFDRDIL